MEGKGGCVNVVSAGKRMVGQADYEGGGGQSGGGGEN